MGRLDDNLPAAVFIRIWKRQSFYVAFEQFTGVKPGYYRKNILEQHAEDTA
jgi:hypothetical protein